MRSSNDPLDAASPISMREKVSAGPLLYLTWLTAVSIIAATLFGFYQLVGPGPFDWHIEQPEFIEGGIELLVVGTMVFVATRWTQPLLGAGLLCLILTLFLRSHGVDVAVLAAAAYCVGILMLGDLLVPAPNGDPQYPARRVALAAAAGLALLAVVSLCATLAVGLSFEESRTVLVATCLLGACLWVRRDHGNQLKWPVISRPNTSQAFVIALVFTCGLAVMARSNVVLYYDSIWYGARPDRVLFGPEGFYDWLGLTTQVHYYPKLYELVMAPLQGWGDQSVAIALGFASWLLLFLAVHTLAVSFGLSPSMAALLSCVTLCTPAALGNAETTKGDLAALAFVAFALVALVTAQRERSAAQLLDVFVFALIASCLRLSVLPYLGLLFVLAVFVMIQLLLRAPGRVLRALSGYRRLSLAAVCVAAFVLVHLRTYLLTGTPVVTTAGMQALLEQLGMALRFPIGTFTASGQPEPWLNIFSVLPATALAPQELRFHTAKWMGAAWFALLMLAAWLVLLRSRRDGAFAMVMLVGLLFPLLLAMLTWQERGGDGNYFILSVAALTLTGVAVLFHRSRVLAAALGCCAFLGSIAYFMGANWIQGSRTFEFRLDRDVWDEPEQLERFLAQGGLVDLARTLSTCERHLHVTGLLPTPAAFALPVRYEPLEEMAWNNHAMFESSESLIRLLMATNTDVVIMPAENLRYEGSAEFLAFVERSMRYGVELRVVAAGPRIDGFPTYVLPRLSRQVRSGDLSAAAQREVRTEAARCPLQTG